MMGTSADGSSEKLETKVRLMNVISAKWWHQWCDYTNFDLDQVESRPSTQSKGIRSSVVETKSKMTQSIDQSNSDLVLMEIQKLKRQASAQRGKEFTGLGSPNKPLTITQSVSQAVFKQ